MRSPRTVLLAALALVVTVVGLSVGVVLRAQAGEREQAQRRFADRAQTSAALTASLFGATARMNRGPLAERLGAATVDRGALDRAFVGGGLAYSALYDARGRVLATGSGMTSANRERLLARPPSVVRVLAGEESYNWSDPLITATGAVVEVVSRVDTANGARVLVRGYPLKSLGPFIGTYLADLPGADEANAYVIDGSGGVIATSVSGQRAPGQLADLRLADGLSAGDRDFGAYGDARHFARTRVTGTSWRVVLTEPDAVLYAGVGGTDSWVLVVVILVAGLAAAGLTWRIAHAKAKLRRTFNELEIAAEELRRSNVELTRSNAELGQFASVASHDLQEPLRKVQTFGDQLERRFGDEIPAEAKDYLRRMRRASARMSTLIDDLLRFSRVTTHARKPRAVDLNKVAREVTMDLSNQVDATQGTVEIGRLPTLEAEPHQMRQLLQNLIGNGLKFHRPGVPPVVTLEPTEAPDADHVAFAVTDNGIGFDPVYGERIFRVFERLHPRDVYEGTGIGLALCRKIVERHGGTIAAAGEPEAGARFLVILPRVQPEAEAPAAAEPAAPEREPVGV